VSFLSDFSFSLIEWVEHHLSHFTFDFFGCRMIMLCKVFIFTQLSVIFIFLNEKKIFLVLFCWISSFDLDFALKSTLYLFYFCVALMFCSQNHEQREEHKKVTTFLRFFVLLPYLTNILCCISLLGDVLLSDLLCISFIFVLDWCFALRFMSTVKNTKNITTFLRFLFFYHI